MKKADYIAKLRGLLDEAENKRVDTFVSKNKPEATVLVGLLAARPKRSNGGGMNAKQQAVYDAMKAGPHPEDAEAFKAECLSGKNTLGKRPPRPSMAELAATN